MFTKTVALFGGAFDPVHRDHVALAALCLKNAFADEVWFMPSPDRWDKKLEASAEDRLEMLRLATAPDSRMVVSDLEIQMGDYRGSYVFMTQLREKFPDIRFRLIAGADSYHQIPHWRDPLHFFGSEYNGHLLLREFELIVFRRDGYALPSVLEHRKKGYAPLHLIESGEGFFGDISSTDIRKKLLKTGLKPRGISSPVFHYICDHKLYRYDV
ncbi:MAG: nicotinate (nicotinamide) nucleotide adenylyltransferase [Fibrobacter sp.]|jgi:nicotinate-nucleotide adenylyltransferase|nr:nicotinate (nicotinamide) nucleotide adenylyltransferase [Fibrobacter sp.]